MKYNYVLVLLVGLLLAACQEETAIDSSQTLLNSWEEQFDEQLPLNGHRNWILVVDKAFPQQPGMQIINSNQPLIPVLEKVLAKISASTHVKPVIFTDAELNFIMDSLAKGADGYKAALKKILDSYQPSSMLHDSVFVNMDKASKLFTITVIKTESVIPYSSVFIQLDCAYWNPEQEKKLREIMRTHLTK